MARHKISFCKDCASHSRNDKKELACTIGWEVGDVKLNSGKVFEGVNKKWVAREMHQIDDHGEGKDQKRVKIKLSECPDYDPIKSEEETKVLPGTPVQNSSTSSP